MKRFVIGIVMVALGLIAIAGSSQTNDPNAGGGGSMFVVIGGVLVYFGKRAMNREKRITEIALETLRTSQVIDARDIAGKMGLSEVHVRELLAHAQRKGIIPYKAEMK